MEFEFQNTEKDYKNFYKSYYKNILYLRSPIAVFLPLFISYEFAGKPFELTKFSCSAVICGLLFIGIFYFIPYLNSIHKLRKLILKELGLEKKKISITDEGLYFETATRRGTWKW